MKKHILSLVSMVLLTIGVFAQQLTVPMNFVVNSPANVAGTYDYGYQSDWGPTTLVTTCGDLAWGYTAAGDSLACTPIVTNLTGKIAMISRGACNFSLKVYHAQAAGAIGAVIVNLAANDPAALINMSGGDSAAAVTIPAVFLGYGAGGAIGNEVYAGNTVNACFFIPQIDGAQGLYQFSTPQSQIRTLDAFYVTIFNNGVNAETNVVGFIEITDPNGMTTTLSESVGTIAAGSQVELAFTGTYTPSALGTYSMKYTVTSTEGSYSADSVTQNFEINPYTYGNDDKETPFAVTPATYPLRYDIGNTYYPTSNGIATHASFGLSNLDLFHGEPMSVILYQTNGLLAGGDYADFEVVGFTSITIDTALYSNNDTIVVAIEALLTQNDLIADSTYLITVQYDALAGSGLVTPAPGFLHTNGSNYRFINGTVYTDQLYSAGWSGGQVPLLRLHMDGFVINTGTKDIKTLDELAATVYPNPAKDFVTLDLNFEKMAENVDVKIIDLQGRTIRNFNYSNIQNTKLTYDIDFLGAGNYFFRVETEEGFTTKHFIVTK
jgi:hypothetical protein